MRSPLSTAGPLAARDSRAYPGRMSEPAPATERIDRAIARIQAAVAARAASGDALARRHAALKARMAEALSALDDVIARGTGR